MNNVLTLRRMLTLRIELIGSDPVIWRRLEIDDGLDLVKVGWAVQIAMGWEHAHLQSFHSAEPWSRDAPSEPITWHDKYSIDEIGVGEPQEETSLAKALSVANGELFFEYDFGDSWMHRITVESRRAKTSEDPQFRVLDGALRAPLEDSGGIPGWYEKLRMYEAGKDDDGEEGVLEWIHWRGGPWNPFDPKTFDPDVANRRLAMLAEDFTGSNAVGTWISESHEGIGRYLSVILAQTNVGLEPTGAPMPAWFVDLVRPYTVLAELCQQGVTLSKAGWMPPVVTTEFVRRCGWEGIDHEKGPVKKEHLMPSVSGFRDSAVNLGILRKAKGVLSTTQRGKKLMDDPVALAQHVMGRLRASKPGSVERDSEFVEWIIRSSGRTTDIAARFHDASDLYIPKSEILANFGYWDPRTNRPVGEGSYLPVSRLWNVIGNLVRHDTPRSNDRGDYKQRWRAQERKLAELSRYILEA